MSKQIYYPQCSQCKKSLVVSGRTSRKQFCDDCLVIRRKARNKIQRAKFLTYKSTKPAYLTPAHIEFIKASGMNFSAFVRTKLDEEMLR